MSMVCIGTDFRVGLRDFAETPPMKSYEGRHYRNFSQEGAAQCGKHFPANLVMEVLRFSGRFCRDASDEVALRTSLPQIFAAGCGAVWEAFSIILGDLLHRCV